MGVCLWEEGRSLFGFICAWKTSITRWKTVKSTADSPEFDLEDLQMPFKYNCIHIAKRPLLNVVWAFRSQCLLNVSCECWSDHPRHILMWPGPNLHWPICFRVNLMPPWETFYSNSLCSSTTVNSCWKGDVVDAQENKNNKLLTWTAKTRVSHFNSELIFTLF